MLPTRRLARRLFTLRQISTTTTPRNAEVEDDGGGNMFGFTHDDLSNAKHYHEIPMPKSYPYVGNLFSFKPFGDLDAFDRRSCCTEMHKRYGNVSRLNLPFLPEMRDAVQIMDPQDFEIIYRNEGRFPERTVDPTLKKYRESRNQGLGLFVSNGDEWWKFRKPMNRGMMKANAAAPYLTVQSPVGDELVTKIKKTIGADNAHEDIMEDVRRYALESICTVVYDKRLGCMDPDLASDSWQQKFIDSVNDAFQANFSLSLNPVYRIFDKIGYESSKLRLFNKSMDYISDTSMKLITEAKDEWDGIPEEELQTKFLAQLLNMKNVGMQAKLSLIFDMLLAAIDTTTYTTINCCYHLAKNPDVQEKLHAELSHVEELDSVKFSAMPYLRACIKENHRMRPIVPTNARQLTKDVVIKGYRLPKGIQVLLEHEYVSNCPDYVTDPDSFIPERWIRGESRNTEEKLHPFLMLPFGFGPRMCIGKRFAEQELNIALFKLVKNFRVEYDGGKLPLRGIGLDKLPVKLPFKFHVREK